MRISFSFAFYAPCGVSLLQHMSTHVACLTVSLDISSLSTCAAAAIMRIPHVSYTHISVATRHTGVFAMRLAVRWQNGHEAEEVSRRVVS